MSQATDGVPVSFRPYQDKAIFMVWGAPSQGPRSRIMAAKLGIPVFFVEGGLPRGPLYALPKHGVQFVKTFALLFRHRPRVIFIQSPPLLGVLAVYLYTLFSRSVYVVDAHSAALMGPWWDYPPRWIKRLLARNAVATMVTNEFLAQRVRDLGGPALILRDIPTEFEISAAYPFASDFNVVVVNTFSSDEPLSEVLDAAQSTPDVHFYVTGKLSGQNAAWAEKAPPNVHFTDFVPNDVYYNMLNDAQAVMCLTTRNHTMQRGACEALSLGRPIITSDWPLLRDYFNKGTVHVDNTVAGIQAGVTRMKQDYAAFEDGIRHLQVDQQQEWQEKIDHLVALIQQRLP